MTVSLTDEHDKPLQGVVITVSTGQEKDWPCALSDEHGHAEFKIPIPPRASSLYIDVVPTFATLQAADVEAAFRNYRSKIAGKRLHVPSILPLVDGKDQYSADLHIEPSTVLSGRLVNKSGEPILGFIHVRGACSPANAAPGGHFLMTGVPKGKPCELFLTGGKTAAMFEVPALQTTQSGFIGDLVLDTDQGAGSRIELRVPISALDGHAYEHLDSVLTLVNERCTIIKTCQLTSNGPHPTTTTGNIELPPGKYFVHVGFAMTDPYFWTLTTLLRSPDGPKRAIEAGIQMVEVSDAKSMIVEVDPRKFGNARPILREFWQAEK